MVDALSAGTLIDVRAGRAVIVKLVPQGEGFRLQPASNWQDLQGEALLYVQQVGGYLETAGLYPCPHHLAQRAVWPPEWLAPWPTDLLTIAEASRQSGVPLKTVHDAVRRKFLPSYHNEYAPGPRHGSTLLSKEDVQARWGHRDAPGRNAEGTLDASSRESAAAADQES